LTADIGDREPDDVAHTRHAGTPTLVFADADRYHLHDHADV
jgi:hypothetical protein